MDAGATGRPDPDYLVVGHCTKPHGIKGEVFVWSLTDHPESTYAPGALLYPGSGDSARPDPDQPPLRVEAARPFRKGLLVRFGGVDSRDRAERMRGWYLLRALDELEPPEEDELFYHELLGMQVVTTSGSVVGRVREVFELQPADLLEVRADDGGTVMIPFVREHLVEVDLDERRMIVDLPDGLLEL